MKKEIARKICEDLEDIKSCVNNIVIEKDKEYINKKIDNIVDNILNLLDELNNDLRKSKSF
ncbi:MAG: hypothetical protein QM532_04455 [Cyanobium sp. MAG06]|nr:hypothetical protein [Cyanobium sp. MAG06]